MQFIVTGRMIDEAVVSPEQEISMLKASFQMFAEGRDKRIKAVYPHADERATTFVVEAETAEEVAELGFLIPASRLTRWEMHPVTTPAFVLQGLAHWEAMMADGTHA